MSFFSQLSAEWGAFTAAVHGSKFVKLKINQEMHGGQHMIAQVCDMIVATVCRLTANTCQPTNCSHPGSLWTPRFLTYHKTFGPTLARTDQKLQAHGKALKTQENPVSQSEPQVDSQIDPANK